MFFCCFFLLFFFVFSVKHSQKGPGQEGPGQEGPAKADPSQEGKVLVKKAPKPPPGAKGDGYKTCLVCGFKAPTEKDKAAHSAIQGHAGFYDGRGRLQQFVVEGKGG